ncbi:hypothetical protein H1R20_g7127, partial [Candolleomyces eurysporus]
MPSDSDLVKAVNDTYSDRALKSGEDKDRSKAIAEAFGYTADELKSLPEEANLGLSCGNPTAIAKLKEGERVLDLGSGGGIDVFLAAPKVRPNGQAIGLDGSAEMVALARKNATRQGLKPPQVAFVQASLEKDLPIESSSIDCVISNCVVNLLPLAGKASVFKEAFRVLKPGGRIALSDIVAKKSLPEDVRGNLTAYISCIVGAVTEAEYRTFLADAGFQDVLLVDRKSDLNVYWDSNGPAPTTSCCSPASSDVLKQRNLPADFDVNEWVGSYELYAVKPPSDEPTRTLETALVRSWDAYPTVKSSPSSLTAEEVAELIRSPEKGGGKIAIVDVRRNDHGGGHVKGSEQWAAQTFYDNLPGFFEKHKNTEKVIFYCQSSNGRGPRSAGWYQDYLDSQASDSHSSKAYVLQGGIQGWKAKYTGESDLVDYD